MTTTTAPRLRRVRSITAYCMVASGLLAAIGCFLPAISVLKNPEPVRGIWALLLGWLYLLPLINPAYRANLAQNVGAVGIANVFVPLAMYFLFFAPRDFKVFAIVLAAVGTTLAARAFSVAGHECLYAGFYCWLASLVVFTVGTIGAVVDELSRSDSAKS